MKPDNCRMRLAEYNSNWKLTLFISLWIVLMGNSPVLNAQVQDFVYKSEKILDVNKKGELSVELDNISFFKNNEYMGTVIDGYTLPGFWIQPKVVYYPLRNIKLEAGAHLLFFHGTGEYPAAAYLDMPRWKGDKEASRLHILPLFRAQIKLTDKLDLVMGSLYGGSNHNLIEPLYNPELNLTTDPESGVQLLYHSPKFDFDTWINWQSFIYLEDNHMEAFTYGLSSRIKFNKPDSRVHFYATAQGVLQHRGGEIDTVKTNSVQTLNNGAAGLGIEWNARLGKLKRIGLEANAVGYYQQAGEAWPIDKGYGWYSKFTVDVWNIRLTASQWEGYDFISLFGLPLYGAMSMKEHGALYKNPTLMNFGLEYFYNFGKGYSLGADLNVYHVLSGQINYPKTGIHPIDAATSYTFGLYLRINPSFLIKKFDK